jgi:hypothetical protein
MAGREYCLSPDRACSPPPPFKPSVTITAEPGYALGSAGVRQGPAPRSAEYPEGGACSAMGVRRGSRHAGLFGILSWSPRRRRSRPRCWSWRTISSSPTRSRPDCGRYAQAGRCLSIRGRDGSWMSSSRTLMTSAGETNAGVTLRARAISFGDRPRARRSRTRSSSSSSSISP